MVIVLYHFPLSAPSRAAVLTAHAVGVEFDIKEINLLEKEQLSAQFMKINPQHTVPTLDDSGFILWESRAIAEYLVDTYARDDSLLPKDVKKRALVNQRLYFDACTLYPRIRQICHPAIFAGETVVSDDKKNQLNDGFKFLDMFLEGKDYVCGNNMTIADISLVASVSSIRAVGWNCTKYNNIENWIQKCSENIPHYTENEKGAKSFGDLVKSKLLPGQF